MRSSSFPCLLLLSADGHWHRTVAQALAGVAQVERLDTRRQVEAWWAREKRPADPVLIDAALVPDVHILKELVRAWSAEALVVITYSVPSWRDAVDLLQAGAADYVRKTEDVARTQARLKNLMTALGSTSGGGMNERQT